ncbi:MAG: hypothetical protein IH984_16955 [Planctomycetes bacterium]|nr:hypothetical protein [Planctomycetota bacterium]
MPANYQPVRHGSLDDHSSAIRRCVENIIIDRDNDQAMIVLRLLPTFDGGQATTKTTVLSVPIKIGKLSVAVNVQGVHDAIRDR